MKRHTLGDLFRAVFAPFVSAYRDEFGARPASAAPANEITTGPKFHPIPASVPDVRAGGVVADVKPPAPVLATAPGQTWREAVAGRLAAEPAGLRPKLPTPKAKPARKPRAPKPKGKPAARRSPKAQAKPTPKAKAARKSCP